MNTHKNSDTASKLSSGFMEKGHGSVGGEAFAVSDEHGYKVEMPREMSVWSAIGLGLAIMVSWLW